MKGNRRYSRRIVPDEAVDMPSWDIFRLGLERLYWTQLFIRCNGNVNQMARIAGYHRSKVYIQMKRLGVGPWLKAYNPNWDKPLEPYADEPTIGTPRMAGSDKPRRRKSE